MIFDTKKNYMWYGLCKALESYTTTGCTDFGQFNRRKNSKPENLRAAQ